MVLWEEGVIGDGVGGGCYGRRVLWEDDVVGMVLWEEGGVVGGGWCCGRRVVLWEEGGVVGGGWCCGRRVVLWEEGGVVGGGCWGVMGGKSVQIQMCSVAMYY